jgi:hypothetical protein
VPKQSRDSAAPGSFVIKARQQAHSRTMSLLSQHGGRTTKTSRMVCHLTEIALLRAESAAVSRVAHRSGHPGMEDAPRCSRVAGSWRAMAWRPAGLDEAQYRGRGYRKREADNRISRSRVRFRQATESNGSCGPISPRRFSMRPVILGISETLNLSDRMP